MTKTYWILLTIILIIGGLLRFVNLDSNPPHLGNDEISIAFDTYSVRLVGKDEHGHFLPISFESHRSYKAPLYAYFNIPFNYLLGNTEYGVRTLSALSGTISIYLAAIIGSLIATPSVGLVAALLMATDPKNIFASRIAYESNLATAILLLGIWGLLKYIDSKKRKWLIVGSFFMGLSIWGYHTEWGLVPMILFILPFVFNKSITIKNWMIAGLIAFMVSFPVYFNFITVQQLDPNNRASSQLWFSTGQFLEYLENKNDSALKKYVKVFTTPVYSYLDHFGFDVNFTTGADLFNKNSPLDAGWFLLSTMPLIFFGIKFGYIVFGKWWKFLLVWWLLCPIIPATTGSISLVRNLPFIVPSTLIMAGGFIEIWRRFVKWRYVLVILFLFNFWMFYMAYFIHYPVDSGNNFQYGYKQAWEFIKPNIDKYNKVVVEDRFGEVGQYIGVPHLYFGYFGAFSVDDMQNRYSDNGLAIGKFRFKYVDWNQETYMPKTVYIVSAINPIVGSFRDKFVKIGVIKNLDYKDQFLIYESIE